MLWYFGFDSRLRLWYRFRHLLGFESKASRSCVTHSTAERGWVQPAYQGWHWREKGKVFVRFRTVLPLLVGVFWILWFICGVFCCCGKLKHFKGQKLLARWGQTCDIVSDWHQVCALENQVCALDEFYFSLQVQVYVIVFFLNWTTIVISVRVWERERVCVCVWLYLSFCGPDVLLFTGL